MALIFCVDDEKKFLDFIGFAFITSAHKLQPFDDAKAALAHLADERNPLPALIILDVNMPGLDGRSFWAALQQNHRTRSIPVIVTTGSEKLRDEFEKVMKVEAFVAKPVDLKVLRGIVDRVLAKAAPPVA